MTDVTLGERLHRANMIRAGGIVILLLSAGAALLPVLGVAKGARLIGALLLIAGLVEIGAGNLRHEARGPAMLAGMATALAGCLFFADVATHFLPALNIIAAWLGIRSIILFVAASRAHGSVRRWSAYSAVMDAVLAVVMLAGLSIANLIVLLFGPTPEMVASFAWALAASFVVTGILLLNIEHCLREADA